MFALALTQPAWLDGRIGPGLFARWLSGAVVAMSLIWSIAALLTPDRPEPLQSAETSVLSGLGLLLGVAGFALAMPITGMVIACGLTALVASWGAGERGLVAYGLSAAAGAGAALAVGLTLLPPSARLWPTGF